MVASSLVIRPFGTDQDTAKGSPDLDKVDPFEEASRILAEAHTAAVHTEVGRWEGTDIEGSDTLSCDPS